MPPLPAPSSEYSACLEPSVGARRAVLASGVVLYLAGAAAIGTLPVSGPVMPLLLVAWIAQGVYTLSCRFRQDARVANFVLDASGSLELVSPTGTRTPARHWSGTIVLERAIWLRFRDRNGRIRAELLTGHPRRDAEFRRAGVLLRLLASGQNN